MLVGWPEDVGGQPMNFLIADWVTHKRFGSVKKVFSKGEKNVNVD